MKAYKVDGPDSDCAVIVFADTAKEAKKMAIGQYEVDGYDWIDIRSLRLPEADHGCTKFGKGILPHSVEGSRFMRSIGWHEMDRGADYCDRCELHCFSDVPESKLIEVGNVLLCGECRAKEKEGKE